MMASAAHRSWQHDPWVWYQLIRRAHVEYGVKNHEQYPGNYLLNITPAGSSVQATFEDRTNLRQLALYRLSAQALLDDVSLPVERPPYGEVDKLITCYNMLQNFLHFRNLIAASDYAPMRLSLSEWNMVPSRLRQYPFDSRQRQLVALVRNHFEEPFEQYEYLIDDEDRRDYRIMPVDPRQERLKPGFPEHEYALGTQKEIGRRTARRYSKHAGSGWSYSSV
ncbi:hypothetical protein JCM10908_000519 [Rhodotorula pacifica]|uniref:uncharacterized protein n=1 Tax=Rhodotorula pacifica TaxID=1495444 RepID=UPI00316F2514